MGGVANGKVSNALIGIAGVHYVVSELSRRGLIAMPTIRNTPGIDVLVAEPDGSAQAVLQIKTANRKKIQQERRQWWPVSKPDKCLNGPNAFYVFVRYDQDKEKFEAFLETADAVVKQVEDYVADEKTSDKSGMLFWGLPESAEEQNRLAKRWRDWRPSGASRL
jgi:hypothetical protein